MSLGLAIADDKRIYLAIENKGINCPEGNPPISSKIIHLQKNPEVKMLVTGGLYHWRDVVCRYRPKTAMEEIRDEIIDVLEKVTECCNVACALILGYKNGKPICYRINKLEHEKVSFIEEPLENPQAIGAYGQEAVELVKKYLQQGISKKETIKCTIEYLISQDENNLLEQPVVEDTMNNELTS